MFTLITFFLFNGDRKSKALYVNANTLQVNLELQILIIKPKITNLGQHYVKQIMH